MKARIYSGLFIGAPGFDACLSQGTHSRCERVGGSDNRVEQRVRAGNSFERLPGDDGRFASG